MPIDSTSIVGNWQIVRAELGGKPMPADAASKVSVTFSATHYTVRFGGEATDQGTYRLDPETQPATIFLSGRKGVNAGRTIPGILQIAGDRLRVCYALEEETPPEQFHAPAGVLHYLATYRRINPSHD